MIREVEFVLVTRVRKKPLKSSYKKKRGGVVRVYKAHIKLAGLQPGAVRKYKCGIARFFNWLSVSEFSFPASLEDLDFVAGEFVNHLFQDDLPLGWGNDFVCGLKRFYPRCRFSLQITSSYLRNWSKSVKRTQALPLTSDILVSLVTCALLRGEKFLASVLLLGFVGLLRTGELVSLKRSQLQFLGGGSQLHISLPDSKGAKRSGLPESVVIRHHLTVKFFAKAFSNHAPQDFIYPCTHASLGRDLSRIALAIGLRHPNLTPYSLRRGGATWLFKSTLNYDYVQDHGRWSQSKTCRIYINQGMADLGQHRLPTWGVNRVHTCVKNFNQVLTTFVDTGLPL